RWTPGLREANRGHQRVAARLVSIRHREAGAADCIDLERLHSGVLARWPEDRVHVHAQRTGGDLGGEFGWSACRSGHVDGLGPYGKPAVVARRTHDSIQLLAPAFRFVYARRGQRFGEATERRFGGRGGAELVARWQADLLCVEPDWTAGSSLP